jgi:hypothetical protein
MTCTDTGTGIGRGTETETERQRDRETERQRGREADRQRGTQTERQEYQGSRIKTLEQQTKFNPKPPALSDINITTGACSLTLSCASE